ncbi:MAG: zinc-dependent metalloprotease [Imperialibacter sp.]|uniref:zinc-dependent metalloprotease n=1 Tax=Imperialibacter sp. TaxID=2038411 RepID=UPI0032F045A0
MKIILFVFSLAISISAIAQNDVRFVADPGQANTRFTSQTGLIRGGQITKSQASQLYLPTGEYLVHWRRSEIKQYDRIFTDDGWIPSSVHLWEGYGSDGQDRFIATTIDGKINSMRWCEKEEYFQLIRLDSSRYQFSANNSSDLNLNINCDFDLHRDSETKVGSVGSRLAYTSCQLIEFQIVSDMALGKTPEQFVQAEAEILELFSIVQTFFISFDIDFNLRVKQLVMPIEESPFPPVADPSVKSFGDVNFYLRNWLENKEISAGLFDYTIGITQFNYNTGNYIGHLFAAPETSLGMMLIERQNSLTTTVATIVHEIGHAFGSGHDPTDGYLMSANISGGSWSRKSKDEINEYMSSPEVLAHFQQCPRLVFSADRIEENVVLNWETSYEYQVSYYVLFLESTGVLDTIPAIGKENEPVSYEFIHKTPALERNIYRIYQYSIYDELVASANIAIDLSGAEAKKKTSYGPNPFREKLHIELGEPVEEITIYDISGRIYLQQKLTESTFDVATGAWKQGLYFFNVDGEVYKIIKQ